MSKNLMIIESPNKVVTLLEFLPKNEWEIIATVGHLMKCGRVDSKTLDIKWVPNEDKKKNFKFTNSKTSKNFTTVQQRINNIKAAAKVATNIYLASDPDREGEAIGWHVNELLDEADRSKVKRITFNEITKDAVLDAISHPRKLDIDQVHAYFARVVLDRKIGFGLSGLFREKIHARGAGRVQTVALKFIYDREQEIKSFKTPTWFIPKITLEGFALPIVLRELSPKSSNLNTYFMDSSKNEVKKFDKEIVTDIGFTDESSAEKLLKSLSKEFEVYLKDPEKKTSKNPGAPFTTDVLYSSASTHCGMSVKMTKATAQKLFEGIKLNGKHIALITYPRTDSCRVSTEFVEKAKKVITTLHGADMYVYRDYANIKKPKKQTAVKTQDGHEAIRVVDPFLFPSKIKDLVDINQYKLYKLIWKRCIAAFMPASISSSINLRFINNDNKFYSHNDKEIFAGFKKEWNFDEDAKHTERIDFDKIKIGDKIKAKDMIVEQKELTPPARYNEASLVRELKVQGVGRPSTYESMTQKPLEYGYAHLEQRAYHIDILGDEIIENCEKFFPDIITPTFTRDMEEELDEIQDGESEWKEYIKKVEPTFIKELAIAEKKFVKVAPKNVLDEKGNVRLCPKCKSPLVERFSPKSHKNFIGCSAYPLCNYCEFPEDPNHHPQKILDEKCPLCGSPLAERTSRRGTTFIGCTAYPKCRYARPSNMTNAEYEQHKADIASGKIKPATRGKGKKTNTAKTKKINSKK
ncbi:MAG: type I DNA topoisomerase [Mycoplasmoidaceae bacterium]|nr:MAG: type I DNA topoisomerase [Mycoplasmoidaceae bacterium]